MRFASDERAVFKRNRSTEAAKGFAVLSAADFWRKWSITFPHSAHGRAFVCVGMFFF
jgi:hypothetical protein